MRIIILIGLLGFAKTAMACSCAWDGDWEAHVRETDVIFTGKAIKRTDAEPQSGGIITSTDPVVFDFKITEAIKGISVEALQVWTMRDDASCGYDFTIDSAYLVFAYRPASDTVLRTSSCSLNQQLGTGDADSILAVVKAAATSSAVRDFHTRSQQRSTRVKTQTTMQTLQERDLRPDGRHIKAATKPSQESMPPTTESR